MNKKAACFLTLVSLLVVSTALAQPPLSDEGTTPSDQMTTRTRRGPRGRFFDRETSGSDEMTSRSRRGPRRSSGPQLPPGTVAPTSAGHLGGATSFTQTMPLDVDSLIAMRRPFTNRPEMRGAWVTRFDWVGQRGATFDPKAGKQRIIETMENAKKLGLNAVFFQVRGDATTLYPSPIEPWSQLIGGKDPGFDPLKLAITEAHKRGLELHAYVNPLPCTEERTSAPASPKHIWYKHCMPESQPNWIVFKDGKPADSESYRYFNPNLPEVQDYVRSVVLDLVKRYDVDGVHFDRIRFPSPDVSDDPWSKARYEGGANPENKPYKQWQADNITRMLTNIYGAIQEIKPKVKVSAAVWGIYDNAPMPQGEDKATGYSWTSSGIRDYMQDSIGWINSGCMDALVPMIYWSMGGDKPDYDELLLFFRSSIKNGRHLYGGQSVFSKEEMIREVVASNLIGAEGTVPFTLNSLVRNEMGDFYSKEINPIPAKTPEMYWKTKPVYGNMLVTVKDAAGKPVVDAHVTVAQRKDVALSSADGFCALLNLVPGEVSIQAQKPGVGDAQSSVTVKLGKTGRTELVLKAQK